ncbi:MAG: PstS family phosphate ABC transporter substrate-binding protein [bacterium]
MTDSLRDHDAPPPPPPPSAMARILDGLVRRRAVLYIVFIAAIAVWKLWPSMETTMKRLDGVGKSSDGQIVLSGADNAPSLVIETIAQFKTQYPKIDMSMTGGGTITALEDLLNGRADVAILSRPPTAREEEIALGRGDSLLVFPVALGGISILAHRSGGPATLSVDQLKELLERGLGDATMAGRTFRVYGPDPNGGLWNALLARLDVQTALQPVYTSLPDGEAVLAAVRSDPASIGFASDLTFDLAESDPDIAEVALVVEAGTSLAPTKSNIVSGSYPLFHYVYMCTTARRGPLAAGFVTYYSQSTGQKWVARRGFMPARLPVREIRLTGGTAS